MAANARRVLIFGGSGFLGQSLTRHLLRQGDRVDVVSRAQPEQATRWLPWDGHSLGDWAQALNDCDGVVNLAGRSVDCVKSPANCDAILRSRVESTRIIGIAMQQVAAPPPVWVQMSTAHIYGDSLTRKITEESAFGYGLAPTVGAAWEAACTETAPANTRTVLLRTSFVLGRTGGALQRMVQLARWGLGGTLGHGQQGISWLHETDMNQLILDGLNDQAFSGPYLATAPNPVSNAVFMRSLRRALRVPFGLPAPGWGIRLAAGPVLGSDPDLALQGRYCYPKRLLDAGFSFAFPDLDAALQNLFRSER